MRKAKRDPEAVSLSGGNLQKFIVGREILREPGVLVVSQPTWGVDAGAAAVIRQALLDLSGRGTAVLVISQDLDELAEIADRIAVMFHGHLSEPLDAAAATREKLGLLMGGSSAGAEPRSKRRAMQLVLERRAERSTVIAIASPLIAIALTLVTMSILFAILGKESDRRAQRLFRRAADRFLFAAGNRREGDAAGDDRDRPVALLSRQCLEYRRRRAIPDGRRVRKLARRRHQRHRRRTLGAAGDAGARRARRRALRADPGDLQGALRRQ